MSTIGEIGAFLSREAAAAVSGPSTAVIPAPVGGEAAKGAGMAQTNGELVPS